MMKGRRKEALLKKRLSTVYLLVLISLYQLHYILIKIYIYLGNNKVGSITVPLTSCLTGLESAV